MTIAMMDEGSEFVVERVCLRRETGKRLADMGFTEGARGWVVRRGFFGGPIQVRLGECDLMIRTSEAEGVDVQPVEGVHHGRPFHRGRGGLGRGPGRGFGRGGQGWVRAPGHHEGTNHDDNTERR